MNLVEIEKDIEQRVHNGLNWILRRRQKRFRNCATSRTSCFEGPHDRGLEEHSSAY